MRRIALILGVLGTLAIGCGDAPDTETSMGAATGVTLSSAGLMYGWGFNPACIFPGTHEDPHFFSAASVGGTLTITGAINPQNNGTFKIQAYLPPATSLNQGNVQLPWTCVSETFPPEATVTYQAP